MPATSTPCGEGAVVVSVVEVWAAAGRTGASSNAEQVTSRNITALKRSVVERQT
jgi:hypothetical protein